MKRQADYSVVKVDRENGLIFISDNGSMGRPSVTNDADNVVTELLSQYPAQPRILYRDSDGYWDELVHDGVAFKGFKVWRKVAQWAMP